MPLIIQLAQNKNKTKNKALLHVCCTCNSISLHVCINSETLCIFQKENINSPRKTCDYLAHSDSVLP